MAPWRGCEDCPVGFYQPRLGFFATCQLCPQGRYSRQPKSESCIKCGQTKYCPEGASYETCGVGHWGEPENDGAQSQKHDKEEYKPSDQRKADQDNVDQQVLAAIAKHPEGASLKAYLKAVFVLSKDQYPHKMTF